MGALHFDEATHTYTKDGVVVQSVTQILNDLSSREYRHVSREVMEEAAMLGKAVHKMIELDLRDDLDLDSLSDELHVYYSAWQNFLQTSGFRMVLSEQHVYSQRYNYAGTLDLAGWLNKRFCIIDAKRTAQVPRTAAPQTAAYRQALAEAGWVFDYPHDKAIRARIDEAERYALHLRKDGTYRLVPFKNKSDLRTFLACKTINYWSNAA